MLATTMSLLAAASPANPAPDWAPVVLLLIIAIGFAVVNIVASIMIGPSRTGPGKEEAYEAGMVPIGDTRKRFNVRFYVVAMIFLVIAPFGLGLANYLIPLQIGAPDMAFPRLNATSYWLFLFGGLIVFAGAATNEGAAAAGWTSYVPLSEITVSTGLGQDFWIVGLALVSVASILTSLNFVTTAFIFRAPGMTMWRLPIFTWEMIATALLIFMAFPSLTATLLLLFIDRRLGGHVFDPAFGGSAVLYQHLFWFFGHPEVYVLILPFFGIVSEIISTFSGRPMFGYTGMVLAAFAIAGLSMGVWAHHMFTTGAVSNPFFSFVSFLIAVPTGIKFFNWICTMWGGAIRYPTAMLFAVGFRRSTFKRKTRTSSSRTSTTRSAAAVCSRCSRHCTTGGRKSTAGCSTSGSARSASGSPSSASTSPSCRCSSWACSGCRGGLSRTRTPARCPD